MSFTPYPKPGKKKKRKPGRLSEQALIKLKQKVLERDRFCQICGTPFTLTAHHIIFLSRGGKDLYENLLCLCIPCHVDVHAERVNIIGQYPDYEIIYK